MANNSCEIYDLNVFLKELRIEVKYTGVKEIEQGKLRQKTISWKSWNSRLEFCRVAGKLYTEKYSICDRVLIVMLQIHKIINKQVSIKSDSQNDYSV